MPKIYQERGVFFDFKIGLVTGLDLEEIRINKAVINFLLIAFVLFMIVRTVNRVNRKLEEASKAIKEKFDDDKEVEVK